MRYRHVRYRYTLVLEGRPRPFAGLELLEATAPDHFRVRLAQPHWAPPYDLYETDAGLTATVELAGVDPDAVDVLLFDNALVVEGQRRLVPDAPRACYHTATIRQGPFRTEIPLPFEVDPERVSATYEQGLLRIALPRMTR